MLIPNFSSTVCLVQWFRGTGERYFILHQNSRFMDMSQCHIVDGNRRETTISDLFHFGSVNRDSVPVSRFQYNIQVIHHIVVREIIDTIRLRGNRLCGSRNIGSILNRLGIDLQTAFFADSAEIFKIGQRICLG